jgi:hypothetical protein
MHNAINKIGLRPCLSDNEPYTICENPIANKNPETLNWTAEESALNDRIISGNDGTYKSEAKK